MNDIYKFILQNIKDNKIDKKIGLKLLNELRITSKKTSETIAVVGMSGFFPKADNLNQLWVNISNGYNLVNHINNIRKDDLKNYLEIGKIPYHNILEGGFIDRIDEFDYEFFKIPPKEAALISPVQRLFLQTAYAGIADAGYTIDTIKGRNVGTYIGFCDYLHENYSMMIFNQSPNLLNDDKVGHIPSMMLGRLNKFLKINGPSILIDTACSSSLVSITMACKELLNNKIDMAIAGGIRINNLPIDINAVHLGIESEDAYSRTFDDNTTGAGIGEGIGIVVLKRISDAIKNGDYIYSVIKGYAVNNESESIGLTAPSINAQKNVIINAWKNAEINPEDLGYIELHGTGTKLGDGVEFEALNKAFREYTDKKEFCAVGSIKSNLGHLNEASGILGFIKTVMVLNHRLIPPTIHFQKPNKLLDIADSSLYVNTKIRNWNTDKVRIAGINSFGLSGTNCHIVLGEYNENKKEKKNEYIKVKFKKNRCWYTDYIENNCSSCYDYKWVEYNAEESSFIEEANFIFYRDKYINNSIMELLSEKISLNKISIDDQTQYLLCSSNIIIDLLFSENDYNLEKLEKLIYFFQNLIRNNPDKKYNITVLCSNIFSIYGEVNYNYKHSIYIGYLKVLCKELSNSECRIIDTDLKNIPLAIECIKNCKNEFIGIRKSKIYTKLFQNIDIEKNNNPIIKENGVYIIFGGASGIGLQCIKYLKNKYHNVKIIIIGRKEKHHVVNCLQGLESNVQYYKANIGDFDKLKDIIQFVLNEYGQINGIINSSGVSNDMVVVRRNKENLINEDILTPKVKGMENLISITQKLKLDFIVVFSSVATVFPLVGQSDYVAANLYSENMSDYMRCYGTNVRCILWTTWKETGMAYDNCSTVDTIFKTLTNKDGIKVFEMFLNSNNDNCIWGKLNDKIGGGLLQVSRVNVDNSIYGSGDELNNFKSDYKKNQKIRDIGYIKNSFQNNIKLIGAVENNYSELQYALANIVNSYLGYSEISIKESFFELGIDSVTLIKIKDILAKELNVDISLPELLENSTVEKLESFILHSCKEEVIKHEQIKNSGVKISSDNEIAIIGLGYLLPHCNRGEVFDSLLRREDFCNDITGIRKNDIYQYINSKNIDTSKIELLKGSFLERIDFFDYKFFNISPNEAKYIAPEQRLALENAFQAIEDAGYGEKITGTKTAVFTAYSLNSRDSYGNMILQNNLEDMEYAELGNTTSVISGRISHYLNLKGPAVNIDSSCSSSLSALVMAVEGLREERYDYAIVQGIKVDNLPIRLKNQSKIGIMSYDGKTRTLDEHSSGFGSGEGIVTLLLKRAKDACNDHDNIYAVIQGIGTNHNGKEINMSAPSLKQQYNLTKETLKDAKLKASDIGYVEMHGTATVIGDNVEFKALSKAFRDLPQGSCPIGTMKTNIGHLSEAAGLIGVLKTIMMMKNNVILPNIGLTMPGKHLNIIESPFYINVLSREWKDKGKIALVNSIGINGTNAQVIIKKYKNDINITYEKRQYYIFTLSAKIETVLYEYVKNMLNYLNKNEVDCLELSYTLSTGRKHYKYRLAFLYQNIGDLCSILNKIVCFGLQDKDEIYYFGQEASSEYYSTENLMSKKYPDNICNAYISGKKIYWESLFSENINKISLPTYPFEKKRAWVTESCNYCNEIKENLFYEMVWEENSNSEWNSRTNDIIDVKEQLIIVINEIYNEESLKLSLIESVGKLYKKIIIADISGKITEKKDDGIIIHIPVVNEEKYISEFFESNSVNLSDVLFIEEKNNGKNITSLDQLKDVQENGVVTLLSIVKAVANSSRGSLINFSIIINNVSKITNQQNNYANSSLIGFGMCIQHEYPNINCNIFDVDSLSNIINNITYVLNQKKYHIFAVRNRKIYNRKLILAPKKNWCLSKMEYHKDDVYIITGGTGGIGITIAKELVELGVTKIVLFCSKNYLNKDHDSDISDILTMLKKRCNCLKLYCFDISDENEIKNALDDIRLNIGNINGIFYCAGRSDSSIIISKNKKELEDIFSSKIYGSWLINNLTKQDNLDFIVYFSSETTTNGEAGQSVYVAGNYFINEFCNANSSKERKLISLSWTTWKEVGMGKRNKINYDMLFKVLDNNIALSAMHKGLQYANANLIIGKINKEYLGYLEDKLKYLSFNVDEEIINEYKARNNNVPVEYNLMGDIPEKSRQKLIQGTKIIQVQLKGNTSYSDIEKNVGICFAKVLGYEEIDINNSFFELGGDSILLTRLQLMLNEIYPNMFRLNDLFIYNSIIKIADYINDKYKEEKNEKLHFETADADSQIAIIGYSFNLPGVKDDDTLVEMLQGSNYQIKNIDKMRGELFDCLIKNNPLFTNVKKEYRMMSYLDNINEFDYSFFNMSKQEADILDPTGRIMLENIHKAIENSGYNYETLHKFNTKFFMGYSSFSEYSQALLAKRNLKGEEIYRNQSAMICGYLAKKFGFNSGAMVIDTACSSSLTAIHMACNEIKNSNKIAVVTCGNTVMNLLKQEELEIGFESKDGITRTFDDCSDGAGVGEGIVTVILKDFGQAVRDRDYIHGIIIGSAVNHNGSSSGITVPNQKAQESVIKSAWEKAHINPEKLKYIELHGTGTKIGDYIEHESLEHLFKQYTSKKNFCAIGSIKTNFGHLYECAGLVSLVKIILMMKNRSIYPMVHFQIPNKNLNIIDSAMYINTKFKKIDDKDILCGISSFGLSGSNCHLIAKNYYDQRSTFTTYPKILKITARSIYSLEKLVNEYVQFIIRSTDIKNITYSLNIGRNDYEYRFFILFKNTDDLLNQLNTIDFSKINKLNIKAFARKEENLKKLVEQYKSSNYMDIELAKRIRLEYLDGGTIDWDSLYETSCKRIPVPTYCFQHSDCWIK